MRVVRIKTAYRGDVGKSTNLPYLYAGRLPRTPHREGRVAFMTDLWPHVTQTHMSLTNVDNPQLYFKCKCGMFTCAWSILGFKLSVSQKTVWMKVVCNVAFGARNTYYTC